MRFGCSNTTETAQATDSSELNGIAYALLSSPVSRTEFNRTRLRGFLAGTLLISGSCGDVVGTADFTGQAEADLPVVDRLLAAGGRKLNGLDSSGQPSMVLAS